MAGSKSISLQSNLLSHLFGLGSLPKPQGCYFQAYIDEENENPQGNNELSNLKKVGNPVKILGWTITNGYINSDAEVIPSSVSNSSRVIIPQPQDDQTTWEVSHWGIWSGEPDKVDSFLLYWHALNQKILISQNIERVYSFAPGEITIVER